MGRRQVWGFVSIMTIKKNKNCESRNLVRLKNRMFLKLLLSHLIADMSWFGKTGTWIVRQAPPEI